MRGYLKKKSSNPLKKWQTRYFILNRDILSYFDTEEKEGPRDPKGVVNLRSLESLEVDLGNRLVLVLNIKNQNQGEFQLEGISSPRPGGGHWENIRQIRVKCPNNDHYTAWLSCFAVFHNGNKRGRHYTIPTNSCGPIWLLTTYLGHPEVCKKEGIFRIPGNKEKVDSLTHKLLLRRVTPENNPVDFSQYSSHTLSSVLKGFLDNLPHTLLTEQLYDEFLNLYRPPSSDFSSYEKKILLLLSRLPAQNRSFLHHLSRTLHNVAQIRSNKMDAKTLGILFGAMFVSRTKPVDKSIADFTPLQLLFKDFIQHYPTLFPRPPPKFKVTVPKIQEVLTNSHEPFPRTRRGFRKTTWDRLMKKFTKSWKSPKKSDGSQHKGSLVVHTNGPTGFSTNAWCRPKVESSPNPAKPILQRQRSDSDENGFSQATKLKVHHKKRSSTIASKLEGQAPLVPDILSPSRSPSQSPQFAAPPAFPRARSSWMPRMQHNVNSPASNAWIDNIKNFESELPQLPSVHGPGKRHSAIVTSRTALVRKPDKMASDDLRSTLQMDRAESFSPNTNGRRRSLRKSAMEDWPDSAGVRERREASDAVWKGVTLPDTVSNEEPNLPATPDCAPPSKRPTIPSHRTLKVKLLSPASSRSHGSKTKGGAPHRKRQKHISRTPGPRGRARVHSPRRRHSPHQRSTAQWSPKKTDAAPRRRSSNHADSRARRRSSNHSRRGSAHSAQGVINVNLQPVQRPPNRRGSANSAFRESPDRDRRRGSAHSAFARPRELATKPPSFVITPSLELYEQPSNVRVSSMTSDSDVPRYKQLPSLEVLTSDSLKHPTQSPKPRTPSWENHANQRPLFRGLPSLEVVRPRSQRSFESE